MVVKSATKKKLMDLGFPQGAAHTLADDRKWDAVKMLTFEEVYALTWVWFLDNSRIDMLDEMKGSKKRLYDIMQNAKEIILKRYSYHVENKFKVWLQDLEDMGQLGDAENVEEWKREEKMAYMMQIDRIDSWWKVTTKENLIELGILPSHPFINWTKSFPFK